MSVGSDPGLARVRDAASCRQWLDGLRGEGGDRLASIRALFERLGRPGIAADALFEIADQARCEQVRSIERWLAPLAGRVDRSDDGGWPRLAGALASLRASRDLFKRAYGLMLERDGDGTRSIIPGATDALRVAMPLARALDAQARIVALLLRHRCAVPAGEWEALCALARHMRRTTFMDEALIDETPLVKPATARALFVYPLLLLASDLPARSPAEARLAERLASRMAAKIGFRIDDGPPAVHAHGPTLALAPGHSVRLDTHRVPASIERRRQQWLQGTAATTRRHGAAPPGDAQLALLVDLERRWTRAALLVAGGAPRDGGTHAGVDAGSNAGSNADGAPAPGGARLRFGLPRVHAGEPSARAAAGAGNYEFGRWEQNTIIRLALGADRDRRKPAELVMAEGEAVDRVAIGRDGRIGFDRHGATPRALPGALAALALPQGLVLGRIESVEQVTDADASALRGGRVTLRRWPGTPMPAGVRFEGAASFADVWLLPGDPAVGELPSLVVLPGRVRAGARALLRERERELPIRFAALLERGSGFERLSLRVENQ